MNPSQKLLKLPAISKGSERGLGVFWRPDPAMVEALAASLQGKKVLEVFAGNGLLAGHLAARGVDVLSTSILSSMDAHCHGLYHPVENLGAEQAVALHGEGRDVLLMCWPTVTDAALRCCELWGGKPIAFIGEVTDYSLGHLGGCATDEFHHLFATEQRLPYQGNMLEQARIGRIAPLAPKAKPKFG